MLVHFSDWDHQQLKRLFYDGIIFDFEIDSRKNNITYLRFLTRTGWLQQYNSLTKKRLIYDYDDAIYSLKDIGFKFDIVYF